MRTYFLKIETRLVELLRSLSAERMAGANNLSAVDTQLRKLSLVRDGCTGTAGGRLALRPGRPDQLPEPGKNHRVPPSEPADPDRALPHNYRSVPAQNAPFCASISWATAAIRGVCGASPIAGGWWPHLQSCQRDARPVDQQHSNPQLAPALNVWPFFHFWTRVSKRTQASQTRGSIRAFLFGPARSAPPATCPAHSLSRRTCRASGVPNVTHRSL